MTKIHFAKRLKEDHVVCYHGYNELKIHVQVFRITEVVHLKESTHKRQSYKQFKLECTGRNRWKPYFWVTWLHTWLWLTGLMRKLMHSYRQFGTQDLTWTFWALTDANRLKTDKVIAKIKSEGLHEGHVVHSNSIHN